MIKSSDKLSEKIYKTVTEKGTRIVPGLVKGLSRESLEDLKIILRNIQEIEAGENKFFKVEAIFATKPTSGVLDELQKQLEKDLGKDILLETRIEPRIIGGLILKQGDLVIDNSVVTRVAELSKKLKTKKATE